MVNYLSTEVSTSRQKKFGMAMFVDTPGLVDGDMNYPFDVDDAIVSLGKHVCTVQCYALSLNNRLINHLFSNF